MNNESDVEILDEPQVIRVRSDSEEILYEERKKRRRKIRQAARRAKGYPSFVSLLTMNYNAGVEGADENEPDPYLVPSTIKIELVASSQETRIVQPKRLRIDVNAKLGLTDGVAIKIEDNGMIEHYPDAVSSGHHRDEGWYEGVIPMTMPEDSHFLSPLQTWVRQQFEFFSATVEDASLLQAGRRPVTVGQVGIRCIHCKAARRCARDSWPIGAISYPANLNSLHDGCKKRVSLHFEQNCPSMPVDVRQELEFIQQSERSAKRFRGAIPGHLYYVVAAKRRGLTDTRDGLRFERDLSLDPLPLDTIRQQQLHQQTQGGDDYEDQDLSTIALPTKVTSLSVAPAARITADEASERVLAQTIAELDEGHLCKAEHKSLLTDFMFLVIRQMKVFHALPSDVYLRAKRAKGVRLGLAGYSCRHCTNTMEHFRSYPSAADNMVSSFSNSFSVHLQKCLYIPEEIKRALAAYKRLHARQMAQLPTGSQRKFMHDYLWERLRAEDKSEEEMAPIIASLPAEQVLPLPPIFKAAQRVTTPSVPSAGGSERDSSYPTVEDEESQAVLQAAEMDWDPAVNDFLIRPEDRTLVSDYVFLAMRQLKAVGPINTARSGIFGLSCIHCHNREHQVSPSGRSYPSAPDNYASALNTSYYNHFLNCTYLPADVNRALVTTRKIHSVQCASLQFGSQRKYFNRLFERLQSFASSDMAAESERADTFIDYGFINVSTKQQPCWVCQKCSGVPMTFRVPGSVWFQTPDIIAIRRHEPNCQVGKWDLSHAGMLLREGIEAHCDTRNVVDGALRSLLQLLFGDDTNLVMTLTKGLEDFLRTGNGTVDAVRSLSTSLPAKTDFPLLQSAFESFADGIQWQGSRDLADLHKFGVFLKFLSPSLEIPSNRDGEEAEVNEEESPIADSSEEFDNPEGGDEDVERFIMEASEEDVTQSVMAQNFDDEALLL